jgi:hypothetical protein
VSPYVARSTNSLLPITSPIVTGPAPIPAPSVWAWSPTASVGLSRLKVPCLRNVRMTFISADAASSGLVPS